MAITETYELTTDEGTDSIKVTRDGDEVVIRFYTDGTETGGPDIYDTSEIADTGRLREYLDAYRHDGYKLTDTTEDDE